MMKEEENIIFNDALNTFYGYMASDMAEDHLDSRKGHPLLPL